MRSCARVLGIVHPRGDAQRIVVLDTPAVTLSSRFTHTSHTHSLTLSSTCCTTSLLYHSIAMQAPQSFDQLSSQAGVDFAALRAKYTSVAREEQSKARETATATASTNTSKQDAALEAMRRLDDYKICNRCQGQGTVKELYNHFWQEKDCPDCDGEAIVQRQLRSIQASLDHAATDKD